MAEAALSVHEPFSFPCLPCLPWFRFSEHADSAVRAPVPPDSPVTMPPHSPSLAPVKKRIYLWSSILAVLALFWLGGKAWQAHKNLVTLDVRDADVRDVLKKIE